MCQGPRETQGCRACRALAALLESQVLRVIWGLQEFQDFKVKGVLLASWVRKEIREIKASPALKVSPAPPALQVLTVLSRGSQDSLVLRVRQV